MSGPPTNNGNKKLPNPPIIAGMTIKNIITMAWAVIILLYNWLSAINWTPGPDNSNLINAEKAVPTRPDNKAKIKYKIPISLALDDQNHLSNQRDIEEYCLLNLPLISSVCHFFILTRSGDGLSLAAKGKLCQQGSGSLAWLDGLDCCLSLVDLQLIWEPGYKAYKRAQPYAFKQVSSYLQRLYTIFMLWLKRLWCIIYFFFHLILHKILLCK